MGLEALASHRFAGFGILQHTSDLAVQAGDDGRRCRGRREYTEPVARLVVTAIARTWPALICGNAPGRGRREREGPNGLTREALREVNAKLTHWLGAVTQTKVIS